MYHPVQEAEQLVIDAINVGLSAMHKVPEEELKESGLQKESGWSVTDREGIAITMTMGNAPRTRLMSTNQGKRRRETKEMIENRNVNIITDADGKKLVLVNDIRFKAKMRDDWSVVEEYLKEYIGDFYEIEETSEKIYISADFPDEYTSSESRIALKGAVAKAKANAAQAIPELIRIAANPKHEANRKEKHKTDAVYGWYRYNIRFALPVYDDKTGQMARHNIYLASMLVRHANDGRKYLYDILAIKKETSSPLE